MTELLQTIEEVSLEDLDHYWMDNGLPVFIANRPDICDIVESMGFQIYYLLTNNVKTSNKSTTNSQTKVTTNTPVVTKSMQLFKVVNNFVGRSVSLSNDPFDDAFISVAEEATYSMPAIPLEIIDKLDQFFRLVDAQHGTESIVMLTYDTEKEGSEGWGVLIPDQQNTSVHCNYDPHSVATIKPDNVMIVGSVHSHPNMSAYASGTDHQDQADFDGIHITYGWQKSVNNGATQYHIELQMAGTAYTLKPEDVFENFYTDKEPDPEVVEWTSKVKKAFPPNLGGPNTAPTLHPVQSTGAAQQTTTSGTKSPNKKIDGLEEARTRFLYRNNLKVEDNAIIVAELDIIENRKFVNCPICKCLLDDFNLYNGYCDECFLPITAYNSSIGKIIASLSYYCQDLYINTDVPVYLWTIDEKDGTESLMKIIETTLTSSIEQELASSNYTDIHETSRSSLQKVSSSIDDGVIDYSYCCGAVINPNSTIPDCSCTLQITTDDLMEFDTVTKSIDLYAKDSGCSGCEYYYDYQCPSWKAKLISWLENKTIDLQIEQESITDINCSEYMPYIRNNGDYTE